MLQIYELFLVQQRDSDRILWWLTQNTEIRALINVAAFREL